MLARIPRPRSTCPSCSMRTPRWMQAGRLRQAQARNMVTTALLESAAAAAAAALDPSSPPSTSGPSVMSPQLQRYQSANKMPRDWDYKYHHFPCASPVEPGDLRCMRIEALFQHVLGYPRLPGRVHNFLLESEASVESITLTVEGLSARFGKEMVLYMVRRCPHILEHTVEEMTERADVARSMLDLKHYEIFTMLRKNPSLLVLDGAEVRARLNKLHRVTPLSHEDSKVMVRKCPLLLNRRTEFIEVQVDKLRHLAYTRATWQQDFDTISPSLMAFFLKDCRDLLLRLEYLALTGDSATWTLFMVFKPSNNLFARKHRGFREWLSVRAARRQQMMMRAERAAARGNDMRSLISETGQSPPE